MLHCKSTQFHTKDMQISSLQRLFIVACASFVACNPIASNMFSFSGGNSVLAQVTTDTFKNAAFAATSKYNNKNLACKDYAITLHGFVQANAVKHKIISYKAYEIKVPPKVGIMYHADYSQTDPITTNGTHYVLLIDGYVFDNHHPKGMLKSSFDVGLIVPVKPVITEISPDKMQNIQC